MFGVATFRPVVSPIPSSLDVSPTDADRAPAAIPTADDARSELPRSGLRRRQIRRPAGESPGRCHHPARSPPQVREPCRPFTRILPQYLVPCHGMDDTPLPRTVRRPTRGPVQRSLQGARTGPRNQPRSPARQALVSRPLHDASRRNGRTTTNRLPQLSPADSAQILPP